jgi:hypothetical protein
MGYTAIFGGKDGSGSFFAAGNERPTVRLNNKLKYGMDMPDDLIMLIDIGITDAAPKNVTVFVSFEYFAKSTPGYKAAAMYRMTIGELPPKEGHVSSFYNEQDH